MTTTSSELADGHSGQDVADLEATETTTYFIEYDDISPNVGTGFLTIMCHVLARTYKKKWCYSALLR